MDLQGENRILVKEGLRRLSHTSNKGLSELIRANGLEDGPITAYHVGFVLGPCINASGRLDTAARSLKLLCAETEEEAAKLAGDLTALNQSRKALTEEGKEEAIRIVEETEIGQDRVLVIYLPDCHESLAGIIAGRIREKYNKPVFVLTKGETMVKSCCCFTGTDCFQSGAQTCVSKYKVCHYEDDHCKSKHKWQCVIFGNITYCINR